MKSLMLNVWSDIDGLNLDNKISFQIDETTQMIISKLDRPYPTTEFRLEKTVTTSEYQEGYIGKYVYDLKDYLKRYLHGYSAKYGLEYGLSIRDEDISNNEIELYDKFRGECEKAGLKTLTKPTGFIVEPVFEDINSKSLLELNTKMPPDGSMIAIVLDWYNSGSVQRVPINKFMHFFIPLELLATDYIHNLKTNWKKEHHNEYEKLKEAVDNILKSLDESKWAALTSILSDLPLSTKTERYLKSLFSESEIKDFWEDSSYVTFNAKNTWKLYSQMSKYPENKEKTNVFNVVKKLIKVRNGIVHYGMKDVENQDIYLIEGILRAVIRKELS